MVLKSIFDEELMELLRFEVNEKNIMEPQEQQEYIVIFSSVKGCQGAPGSGQRPLTGAKGPWQGPKGLMIMDLHIFWLVSIWFVVQIFKNIPLWSTVFFSILVALGKSIFEPLLGKIFKKCLYH